MTHVKAISKNVNKILKEEFPNYKAPEQSGRLAIFYMFYDMLLFSY